MQDIDEVGNAEVGNSEVGNSEVGHKIGHSFDYSSWWLQAQF